MAPGEALRPQLDRLARLLADARGTEILAELQRLAALLRDPDAGQPVAPDCGCESIEIPADGPDIGIWRAEPGPDGVALRRRDVPGINPWHWADTDYVPPQGDAHRVVLIGESVARGWVYDPMINPTMALARRLDLMAPGRYQCVDLAQAGATAEDLTRLVRRLPVLAPDTVVVMAGNNWGCYPDSPPVEFLGDLIDTVRTGGYPAMRRMFITKVIVPRARMLADELRALHAEHGTRIVVVVPEFNLRGWAPPADIDLPALPREPFTRWHRLGEEAARAAGDGRWADVIAAARQMSDLDGGSSPVPGQLIGRAAAELGDGALARAGLEASRDALAGLGIANTPRIIGEVRDVLTEIAGEDGFAGVDMGAAIASGDLPELPDARFFFDYCHLSDDGIERVMGRVADAVLGLSPGTVTPGPGVEPPVAALIRLLAAAHGAYHGQPCAAVRLQLRLAVEADPAVTTALTWLLDLLEGTGPVWARPAVEPLANAGPGSAMFGPVLASNNMPPQLWTLRACLGEVLDRAPAAAPAAVDLLAAPFSDGHRPPNLAPGRAFHQATARRSVFAFTAATPLTGLLEISYRMPTPQDTAAVVAVNEKRVGTLPASEGWASVGLSLPAELLHPGVNWLSIEWPVPRIDVRQRIGEDTAAMARGEFPYVLAVFGELFDARLSLDQRQDASPIAAETSAV